MTSLRSVRSLGWMLLVLAILAMPGRSFAQGIARINHDCTAGFARVYPTGLSRRRLSLDARLLGLGRGL